MSGAFKTRHFLRWAKKTGLPDAVLCHAILEMEAGLIDAHLGGGIVKKRIALPGRGKSGSVRTLVATSNNSNWFFIFGFEKKDRDNIDAKESDALKEYASELLKLSSFQLGHLLETGALLEICRENKN